MIFSRFACKKSEGDAIVNFFAQFNLSRYGKSYPLVIHIVVNTAHEVGQDWNRKRCAYNARIVLTQ